MNRTDRLLAIVLELQARKRQRAEDLAATFETSKRTIYRDIQALCEAGVPVAAIPGQGYSLVEGYFLPPLAFNADEAVMLLLGSEFMAQNFDAQYRAAAQSASRKIEAVLPEKLHAEVHDLQTSLRFISGNTAGNTVTLKTLQMLRRAVLERSSIRFRYHTRFREKGAAGGTMREADPYSLSHIANAWYLVAYCHLRRGIRHFRLDRMEDLTLLDITFTRPAGFKIEQREVEGQRNITVRALFDPEVSRWVREAPSFFTIKMEDTTEGLLLTLQVRHEQEIVQWLLSWGQQVKVLEPLSLCALLVEEARGILRNHRIGD